MPAVIVLAVLATTLAAARATTLPPIDEAALEAAYCKVLECTGPGTGMPKVLYDSGLAKCKKMKGSCYDVFRPCVEGIAKALKLKAKTDPDDKDAHYDMEDTSDPFLAKVKQAIIRYASHNYSTMSPQWKLLTTHWPWTPSSGLYCN